MTMPQIISSYLCGEFLGKTAASPLYSAINGELVASTHAEKPDLAAAVDYARRVGFPNLIALNFQARAARLKALAQYILARKEELYTLSRHTGATRPDSWIDIEGGTGTLFAYASMGSRELPSSNVLHEGPPTPLGKGGQFYGSHILVPSGGIAVHINAFNFPIWGMLEKFAPSFLAATPCLVKPATTSCYLAAAVMRMIAESGIIPAGSLQLVIGSLGDGLSHLDGQDHVTFTGSAATAAMLRATPNLIQHNIPFTAEADSLNSAILAPDIGAGDPEYDLFIKEITREMTAKAGQKCTAIRRIMVPRASVAAIAEKLRESLAKITIGDPAVAGVRMGALASRAQRDDVAQNFARLAANNEVILPLNPNIAAAGEGVTGGAFAAPGLILCQDGENNEAVHQIEAFGPCATIMPYDDFDQACVLAARGRGSLVATLASHDAKYVAHAIPMLARHHGRLFILDRDMAAESTGHGSPLPMLKHGGPGRAGGGEELGGIRAVKHFLQRAAVQGSPSLLTAVTGEYVRGAAVVETDLHPFRYYFEDVAIGQSLRTHRRTVTEADIVNFGGISGDYFYMHFDELAARESQFGQRIAHGYFVLSAAAGLFVWPAPGPILANYGLDTLRFVKPVAMGDTIQARLTCKRKTDRGKVDERGVGQGVVAWEVLVSNQLDEIVASYDILTLVAKRGDPTLPAA